MRSATTQFALRDSRRLDAYVAANPHRIATKHAHSQLNPERLWGKFTVQSIRFAFWALNDHFGVNPHNGASSVFAAIPVGGLNALAFDRAGNVYVSDSGRGIIWRSGPGGGTPVACVDHPLLRTCGVPALSAPTGSTSTAPRIFSSSPTPAMTA